MPKGIYERTKSIPINRFLKKIDKIEFGCWEWQAGKMTKGYGRFYDGEKTVSAHRWSYEYFKEVIPNNLVIDHLCRNPACVNPNHLECVSVLQNTMRGMLPDITKAKWKNMSHCKRGHEFTRENTIIHRKKGTRNCRTCQKMKSREWSKNNRARINEQLRFRRQQKKQRANERAA